MKTAGIYLHIPFCEEKCSYCDFLTFPHQEKFYQKYVDALCKEITAEVDQRDLRNVEIDSIFFGGGTPTVITAPMLNQIFNTIYSNLKVSENAEITVEANPKSLSDEVLKECIIGGVNRLSFGVQTTSKRLLDLCRRKHSKENVIFDVERAEKAGINNINFDMIYAIPTQTEQDLERDFQFIKELRPEHVSWYSLILEEKTLLNHWVNTGKVRCMDEESEIKFFDKILSFLSSENYVRYEISNFAKPGYESKHNLKYWTAEPYWGVGLGASSYLNRERSTVKTKFAEFYDLIDRKLPVWDKEDRTKDDDVFEQIMMGLRKIAGISRKKFYEINNFDVLDYSKDFFEENRKKGLFDWNDERIWLTDRGLLIQNSILSDLLLLKDQETQSLIYNK